MPNCHRGSTLAFHLGSFAHLGVHLEVLLQSDRCTHSPPPHLLAPPPIYNAMLLPLLGQCYKTFLGCKSRIFLLSKSVCRRQAFQPSLMFEGKASSLP
jgi:hypothetical protein